MFPSLLSRSLYIPPFLPFFSFFNLFHLKREKKIEDLPLHRRRLFPLLFYCVSKARASKARFNRGTLFFPSRVTCWNMLPTSITRDKCFRLVVNTLIRIDANAPTEPLSAPWTNTTCPIILYSMSSAGRALFGNVITWFSSRNNSYIRRKKHVKPRI